MVKHKAIITYDKDVAQCPNYYFASIVESLNIPCEVIEDCDRSSDPVVDAINVYVSHQSIKKSRDVDGTQEKFEFSKVEPTKVFSKIYRLDRSNKIRGDIPVC